MVNSPRQEFYEYDEEVKRDGIPFPYTSGGIKEVGLLSINKDRYGRNRDA